MLLVASPRSSYWLCLHEIGDESTIMIQVHTSQALTSVRAVIINA